MAEAHAPGKLVICGEYAVLAGAPAIAAAVDVQARASVTSGSGPSHLLVAGSGAWPFETAPDGRMRWREAPPGGQAGVLEAVAAMLAAEGIELPSAVEIALDTRAFLAHRNGEKLGLGSSAAVVVALVAALLAVRRHGRPERDEVLRLSFAAHRRLQGGGSGVDVAASVAGGIVALSPRDAGDPGVRALAWPEGLAWLAVWTGRGASTPALVARFERFRRDDAARFGRHMTELHRLATATVENWERGERHALLRSLADYDDALRALDDGARIGIYTPEHERLAREAQAVNAVYKVSGAGGGDFGLAFADSPDIIAGLRSRWAGQGLAVVAGDGNVAGVAVNP